MTPTVRPFPPSDLRCVYVPGRPPQVRAATHRLLRVLAADLPRHSVEWWDQQTAGNHARAALSLAAGACPDEVHPALGTWGGAR
jgi:hypothetical protein